VEVGKVRVDHGSMKNVAERETADGLTVVSSVNPQAIKDQMISSAFVCPNQVVDDQRGSTARDFESDQPVVVRTRREYDRAGPSFSGELNLGQHILW
jgi:hypothetical protein